MLPAFFKTVNQRTQTPVNNTIVVAIVVALLAGLLPINFLAEDDQHRHAGGVPRRVDRCDHPAAHRPDLERGFRVPLYPVVPILSVLGCLWIIIGLDLVTIAVFVIWVAVVLVWYFAYGISHSRLNQRGLRKDAP